MLRTPWQVIRTPAPLLFEAKRGKTPSVETYFEHTNINDLRRQTPPAAVFCPSNELLSPGDLASCGSGPFRLSGCLDSWVHLTMNWQVTRQIARHGKDYRYHHVSLGVKSRLGRTQAAALFAKMEIPDEIKLRHRVANDYGKVLNAPGPAVQVSAVSPHDTTVWARYTLFVERRDAVQTALALAGIPTAVHITFR